MRSSTQMPPVQVRPPLVPPKGQAPYTQTSPTSLQTEPSFGAMGGHGAAGGSAHTQLACPPQGPPKQSEQPQNVFPYVHSVGSIATSQSPEGAACGQSGSGIGSLEQPGATVSQPLLVHWVRPRQTTTMPPSVSQTSPTEGQGSPSGGGEAGQGEPHITCSSGTHCPLALQACG